MINCPSYNESTMTLVPVIASFDASGNIRPLYIGVHGESYKVLTCSCKKVYDFPVYKCQVEDHGIARHVDLTYHPREHIWTIPKVPDRM